jgi:twinkle protein
MINWNEIKLKSGSGNYKTTCPACSHTRKNKNDPCLSVNPTKGAAKCWNCDEVSIRDLKEAKRYDLPPQKWSNHTSISDNMVKWFKSREISQKTLIDCKVTEEKYYQPALQKEVNNIAFNYFDGEILVNKKFRSGSKNFTQCKNAKKVFYGINDIEDCKEIYIVEGEMDKLAFWEVGVKNCVSVPNGAKDLNDIFDTCKTQLKKVEKVFIAVDMDEAGLDLERGLIKRFGKWKCERIQFNEKDANDELIKGKLGLLDCINNPIKYPVDGTFTAGDIKDDIFDLYESGIEETVKPKNPNFVSFNRSFSILWGQLTVVTGIPSHGKSNWLEWYLLNLCNDNDYKVSFYSPEHFPLKLHQSVLASKFTGKPFDKNYSYQGDNVQRMTKKELNEYIEWSKDHVYLTAPEDNKPVTWEYLMAKFKEQMFRYGIDIFVIDAFNKVKMKNRESLGEINDILSDITAFAHAYNVHIFLIAHPTKMHKDEKGVYKVPDLYNVKGSGDFRDQTHNGLTVYRNYETGFTEVHNTKTKFKHQGDINTITEFKYDLSNGRYYDNGSVPDRETYFKRNFVKVKNVEFNFDEPTEIDFSEYNKSNSDSMRGARLSENEDVFEGVQDLNNALSDDAPF